MRRAARVDANQAAIVSALEAAGASVLSLAAVGKGCPDLLVGHQNRTLLVEVKNPDSRYGKAGANANQRTFMELWRGGSVAMVDGPEAALRALGVLSA